MRTFSFTVEAKDPNEEFWWLKATDNIVITDIKDNADGHELHYGEICHKFVAEQLEFNLVDAISRQGTDDGIKLWQMTIANDASIKLGFLSDKDRRMSKTVFINGFFSFKATSYAPNGEVESTYLISRTEEDGKITLFIIECCKDKYDNNETCRIVLNCHDRTKTFAITK